MSELFIALNDLSHGLVEEIAGGIHVGLSILRALKIIVELLVGHRVGLGRLDGGIWEPREPRIVWHVTLRGVSGGREIGCLSRNGVAVLIAGDVDILDYVLNIAALEIVHLVEVIIGIFNVVRGVVSIVGVNYFLEALIVVLNTADVSILDHLRVG